MTVTVALGVPTWTLTLVNAPLPKLGLNQVKPILGSRPVCFPIKLFTHICLYHDWSISSLVCVCVSPYLPDYTGTAYQRFARSILNGVAQTGVTYTTTANDVTKGPCGIRKLNRKQVHRSI